MLNIIGKKTIFEFSKYQLVTLTNFITRTSIIYIFSDYLLLPYNYVFWYSLLYIILQGYFLHKNFVFREQTNSFFKYLFINVLFGLFDFISSSYLFEYLDFLATQPIERVLLPDTLGILTPEKTENLPNKILPNSEFISLGNSNCSKANTM